VRGEPRLTDLTNPGALPMEQPMMVEWVITLKTAQALGVEIRLPGECPDVECLRIVSTDLDALMCKIQRGGRVYLSATHRTRMQGS
jgi:hypothetical protein